MNAPLITLMSYLQRDINTFHKCTSTCHLTLNPSKCKYTIVSKRRQPHLPPVGLRLHSSVLEQVESYRYLGVLLSSKLTWNDHIDQICTKARKPVRMLYRRFSTWADTNTLLCIYLTCIRHHLDYACQLWDPHTSKGIQTLEAVQTFVCKVCLKRWDLDYDSMLQLLDLQLLFARRQHLKLSTMFNITTGNSYFSPGIFFQVTFLIHVIIV